MDRCDAADRIGFYFRKEKWILLVIAVTGILYNAGMVAGPWFEGQMVQCLCDILGGNRQGMEMATLATGYVLAILLIQFMRCLKRLYVRKFANHISKGMKMTLYRNLLHRRREDLEEAGSMMAKIISDADACVEGMRKFTTEVFDTGVVMVAYLAMLLSYDWKLTLFSMLFPPIAYFLAERMKVIVTKNVALSRESSAGLNAATLERITNAMTYRIYGQESSRNAAYEENLADYEKKAVRANIWENAMPPIYQVISMLGAIAIIWFGGRNVAGMGWAAWDIAAFTAFFSCYQKLAVKSSKAAKLFNAVQKAQVSWKRIKPYLGSVEDEAEPEPVCCQPLLVRNVAFSYPGQKPLIANVTFQAEPGEIVGLTGKIACGKSTLGRLLTGELPYQGEIFLGDARFPNQGGRYGNSVGYLGHQPELFSGTIEENICMGRPGDIGPVLRAVCIDREVAGFSDGIHTVIGSGGIRLSGGQQARIALARTLYHRKPLMILDDPFSAVDMETEARIFENLRILAEDSVVLLISHRLSLFPQMGQVLWLEGGKVTAASHGELMQENARYRALYEAQREEAGLDEN